jgi:uncharacterized MAPEG superfamily protein
MNSSDFGSVEMQMLWLSIALGLVQIVLPVFFALGRTSWAIGPRDEAGPPIGKIGARLERALKNFLETFVLFAAVVLLAQAMGRHSANSALGAQLYFWARLAYVPTYAAGVPFLRTLIWAVSLVGIVLVFLAAHPGM